MIIKHGPNFDKVSEIQKENGNMCPCYLKTGNEEKDKDYICICKPFKEKIDKGEACICHCGKYEISK